MLFIVNHSFQQLCPPGANDSLTGSDSTSRAMFFLIVLFFSFFAGSVARLF